MNSLIKIFSILVSILLITPKFIKAQDELKHEAPTLQVGLDGLSFGQGTLDAKIIMQMVAEKQKEVGLKIVQNMFLSKMENAGGAFYSFTDNVIRGIITEKDPDIMTRKILENTVNITFTYAFADYYVRQLHLTSNVAALSKFNLLATDPKINLSPAFSAIEVKKGLLGIRNRGAATQLVRKEVGDETLEEGEPTFLIALIVDMASEAIRQNEALKELGIMQVSYAQSYDFMNEYLSAQKDENDTFDLAEPIYLDMVNNLNDFTNMIGLIYYHVNSNSYRLNGKNLAVDFSMRTLGATPIEVAITTSSARLKAIHSSMQAAMYASSDTTLKRKLQFDLQSLSNIYYYMNKAALYAESHNLLCPTDDCPENLVINSDIVYTLYADIIPKLTKMSVWDTRILDEIDTLEMICRTIEIFYINDVTNRFNNDWVQKNVTNFIDIISRAYQFDKANTFSNSVKILADLENIFPNERIKDAVSFINTYVRDFVAIKKDAMNNEYIDFNVESFLAKLSQVKADKLRRGSVLFTVGVNTVWFAQPQILSSDESISNLSFVSEKIGFKLKLADRAFWMTRNPGESYEISNNKYTKNSTPYEPIISDWHMIFYGSGILYNIVNTSTSKSYKSPLVGIGTGLTFFNSLDMNVTVGVPIPNNEPFAKIYWNTPVGFYQFKFNNVFYGIGFDFPFIEYIQRINQNAKANKNKKILSKMG